MVPNRHHRASPKIGAGGAVGAADTQFSARNGPPTQGRPETDAKIRLLRGCQRAKLQVADMVDANRPAFAEQLRPSGLVECGLIRIRWPFSLGPSRSDQCSTRPHTTANLRAPRCAFGRRRWDADLQKRLSSVPCGGPESGQPGRPAEVRIQGIRAGRAVLPNRRHRQRCHGDEESSSPHGGVESAPPRRRPQDRGGEEPSPPSAPVVASRHHRAVVPNRHTVLRHWRHRRAPQRVKDRRGSGGGHASTLRRNRVAVNGRFRRLQNTPHYPVTVRNNRQC